VQYCTVQCSLFERISSRKRSRSTVPSRTNERKSGKMSHICLEESCIVPYGAAQGSLLDVLSLPVACDFLVHEPRIVGSRSIISANLAQVGFPRFDSPKTGHGHRNQLHQEGDTSSQSRDYSTSSMIFRFPVRSCSGPCQFFRFPVRSFSGFLPGRVPFFLLCVWSVLLFPFAPLVDYLCVIQLREISPCVLPRPVSPYSYVWSSLDSKGAVS